ncbi:MAG: hypothetical protein D6E12_03015 [Desulfovibrio sp.]|nr:MAG: hypothetical protein D6E12_03015 [Desulfovibrio sp.]
MIIGWKNIQEATGLSRNLLRRLRDEEDFPIARIGNRPATSEGLIEKWLAQRIDTGGSKGAPPRAA